MEDWLVSLKAKYPKIVEKLDKAKKYYNDNDYEGCAHNCRQTVEGVVCELARITNTDYTKNLSDDTETLSDAGYLPDNIKYKIDKIRWTGNQSSHYDEDGISKNEAWNKFKKTKAVCCWFTENYVNKTERNYNKEITTTTPSTFDYTKEIVKEINDGLTDRGLINHSKSLLNNEKFIKERAEVTKEHLNLIVGGLESCAELLWISATKKLNEQKANELLSQVISNIENAKRIRTETQDQVPITSINEETSFNICNLTASLERILAGRDIKNSQSKTNIFDWIQNFIVFLFVACLIALIVGIGITSGWGAIVVIFFLFLVILYGSSEHIHEGCLGCFIVVFACLIWDAIAIFINPLLAIGILVGLFLLLGIIGGINPKNKKKLEERNAKIAILTKVKTELQELRINDLLNSNISELAKALELVIHLLSNKEDLDKIKLDQLQFLVSGAGCVISDITMVKCSAGSFIMGSPTNETGRSVDEKQHQEIIDKDFYIGIYPITNSQYKAIMKNSPSHFTGDCNPVELVSWFDAKFFCKILNETTANARPDGYVFDLPTETQWEYACRAGTQTALNNGKDITTLDEVGWYRDNSNHKTHPVGLKEPNAWGIYDMHGNVCEWCKNNAFRGGSWDNDADRCRSANRNFTNPGYKGSTNRNFTNPGYKDCGIGFRVALVPEK